MTNSAASISGTLKERRVTVKLLPVPLLSKIPAMNPVGLIVIQVFILNDQVKECDPQRILLIWNNSILR